jgi:hypothetical protein
MWTRPEDFALRYLDRQKELRGEMKSLAHRKGAIYHQIADAATNADADAATSLLYTFECLTEREREVEEELKGVISKGDTFRN